MDPLTLSQVIQSIADAVDGKSPHTGLGENISVLVTNGSRVQTVPVEQLVSTVAGIVGDRMVAESKDHVKVLTKQVRNLEQIISGLAQKADRLASLEERLIALEQQSLTRHVVESDPLSNVNVVVPDEDGNIRIGAMSNVGTLAELKDVTMVGNGTVAGVIEDRENVTAIGSGARPTASHQVVLGDHRATLQTLNPAHRRADIRDMYEPRPCSLGLDFVKRVDIMEFQNDFRESYLDWRKAPRVPTALRPEPTLPELAVGESHPQALLVYHASDKARWKKEKDKHDQDMDLYNAEMQLWRRRFTIDKVRTNGANASPSTHVGFNGRQVLKVLAELKKNMGLVQAHEHGGGESTTSVAEGEMTAILWKAVQELHNFVTSDEFTNSIASDVIEKVGG